MIALVTVGLAVCAVLAWMPAHPGTRLAWVVGHPQDNTATKRVSKAWRAARLRLSSAATRARRRRDAIEALQAFSGELRAGQPMRRAIPAALSAHASHACAAATWGGDVAEALRRDADAQDIPLWRSVAACWQVSEASGAGLAAALDRLVVTARAAEEVRVQLESHLAAPRATARMLSLLPAMGILLGMTLGGDPLGWLLGSLIGRLCLVAGIALTLLGLWWVQRIAKRVERLL